jgi:hypothetical protein
VNRFRGWRAKLPERPAPGVPVRKATFGVWLVSTA